MKSGIPIDYFTPSGQHVGSILSQRFNKYENYRGEDIRFLEIISRQTKDIAMYIAEDKPFKPYIAKW